MKASIVKLLVAFLMIGTMAGCVSTGGGPNPELYDFSDRAYDPS
jgi:hypothetical protein